MSALLARLDADERRELLARRHEGVAALARAFCLEPADVRAVLGACRLPRPVIARPLDGTRWRQQTYARCARCGRRDGRRLVEREAPTGIPVWHAECRWCDA